MLNIINHQGTSSHLILIRIVIIRQAKVTNAVENREDGNFYTLLLGM
jgi:hypothetical protein